MSFASLVGRQKTSQPGGGCAIIKMWGKFEQKTDVLTGTYNEDSEEAGSSSWSSLPDLKEAPEDLESVADLYSGTPSPIYNHRRSWLIV